MTSRTGAAIPVEGQLGGMDAGLGGLMGQGGMGGVDIESQKMKNLGELMGLEQPPPAETEVGGVVAVKAAETSGAVAPAAQT